MAKRKDISWNEKDLNRTEARVIKKKYSEAGQEGWQGEITCESISKRS